MDTAFQQNVVGNTCLKSLKICSKAYSLLGRKRLVPALESLAVSTSSLTSLALHRPLHGCNDVGIGIDGARAMQALIASNPMITTLKLQSCALEPHGIRRILDALSRSNLGLCEMDLDGNLMGNAIPNLAKLLASSTSLQILSLSLCNIDTEGANTIGQALEKNCHLKFLNLSSNHFALGCAGGLIQGMKHNTVLQVLDLSNNIVRVHGARALADEVLVHNKHLVELNLEHTGLGREGAELMGEMLEKNHVLQRLNLRNNHIAKGGGIAVGRALACDTCSLQALDLGLNQLGISDLEVIGDSLKTNTTLVSLKLGPFHCEKDQIASVAAGISQNTALLHLELAQHGLEQQDCVNLATALSQNQALQYLDLSSSSIVDHVGMHMLCNAVLHHSSLLILELPMLQESSHDALAHLLTHNATLQRVSFKSRDLAITVLHSLKHNKTLESLNMQFESLSRPNNLAALAHALHSNVTLSEVTISTWGLVDHSPISAICNALRENPRYHRISITGIDLAVAWNHVYGFRMVDESESEILSVHTEEGSSGGTNADLQEEDEWSNESIIAHIHGTHVAKVVAFAAGQHARLGEASLVRTLSEDDMRMVVLCFFGLPLNYFQMRQVPRYVRVMKRFGKDRKEAYV